MATRIEQDAFAILKALVERQERRNVDAKDLAEQTSLDPDRLNDAVTLLVDSGLVEWIRVIAHALCPHDSQIECHRVQAMDCGQR